MKAHLKVANPNKNMQGQTEKTENTENQAKREELIN
jgi:hypothetical protein